MKKKSDSLHDLAVRLCEGGVVEFGGYCLKAKELDSDELSCYECSMDSVCDVKMSDLCCECDNLTYTQHILEFADSLH